jgi:hypothetical protein
LLLLKNESTTALYSVFLLLDCICFSSTLQSCYTAIEKNIQQDKKEKKLTQKIPGKFWAEDQKNFIGNDDVL